VRVTLFRTISAEARTSMDVYADELAAALVALREPSLELAELTAGGGFRSLAGSSRRLSRLGGFADRYAVYQLHALRARTDVAHILDHGYGHLAASTGPARTVVTFHDALLLKLRSGEIPRGGSHRFRFTAFGQQISLLGIRRAARIITDSESAKADLLRLTGCDSARVRVVPLGVESRFCPARPSACARIDVAARQRPVRILHVGHCGVAKNIDGLLRAVSRIEALLEHPVRLVKAGGDFTAAQKELIGDLRIEASIEHVGMVAREHLPGLYRSADVVVVPSHYEGFGLPVLEAMACGTPVVAARAASLPEVVGDAGLLVEPSDIDSIASHTARVLADPRLAADLRERGLRRARAFTWERTARATLDVYREVAIR